MRIHVSYLIATATAAAVIAAPVAAAEQNRTCTDQGSSNAGAMCSNPGNTEVTATPQTRGPGSAGYSSGFYPGGPYAVPFTHR